MERALSVARVKKDGPKDLRSKSPNEAAQVERKSKAIGSCVVQTREPFIDYASNYGRLLRTVTWIRRFIRNSKLIYDDLCKKSFYSVFKSPTTKIDFVDFLQTQAAF